MSHSNAEWIAGLLKPMLDQRAERQRDPQVRPNLSPDALRAALDLELPEDGVSDAALGALARGLLELSVNASSPLFMNQLYGHIEDVGIVGDALTSMVNTSMATYEIAPLLTLVEQQVVRQMGAMAGFEDCDGLLTPGGSLSNMQAMLMAKDQRYPEARVEGAAALPPVRIFVSDQAHYSFVKFAQVLGLGRAAVVTVPSSHKGAMQPDALEARIRAERDAGNAPLMVAATAGTTVSGVYDDLEALADIAEREGLWFHVDGSYGGSLLMHPDTRDLLRGVERADSFAWNPHKMLGMPLHCPVLITPHLGALEASLTTAASYLFHEDEDGYERNYNTGQKSLHCGRRPEVVKFWLSWKHLGRRGLGQRVLDMVQAARGFAAQVEARPDLTLLCAPEAPIVCFQYRSDAMDGWPLEQVNALNQQIRERLFAEGELVFNYAHISDLTVLRCVISSPHFTQAHASQIIAAVERVGAELVEAS